MNLPTPFFQKPIKLSANNFTPLTRTPWAGQRIAQTIKRAFVSDEYTYIGESWEFSCDPQFPSRIDADKTMTVEQLVRDFPEQIFGMTEESCQQTFCEILVKLIEAKTPLSLQVHPEDNDPYLSNLECGKPESWYVLDAPKGAGIYLGFSEPITKTELRISLEEKRDIKNLLQFIPVTAGDYFEIQPGVPHAVGPNVLLLEPQRIRFQLSGKTYRLWDWNRLYDASGQIDMKEGIPRELHIDAALRIIDPENQWGMPFVDSLRRHPAFEQLAPDVSVITFPANDHYQLRVIKTLGDADFSITQQNNYGVLVVLKGKLRARQQDSQELSEESFNMGETALLPSSCFPITFEVADNCEVALITPKSADVFIK